MRRDMAFLFVSRGLRRRQASWKSGAANGRLECVQAPPAADATSRPLGLSDSQVFSGTEN